MRRFRIRSDCIKPKLNLDAMVNVLKFELFSICSQIKMLIIRNGIRPNKKIIVFRLTGLKISGRVGEHIFFQYFFSGKNII